LGVPLIFAQYDSISQRNQKIFDDFKSQINNDFIQFQSKNDSIFYIFLNKKWEEFTLFRDELQTSIKPKKQPVSAEQAPIEMQIFYEDIIDKSKANTHKIYNDKPQGYQKAKRVSEQDLSFHGIQYNIEMPPLSTKEDYHTEKGVAKFYKNLCLTNGIETIADELAEIRKEYSLNDWAFFDLLQNTAKHHYHDENEQVLFVWYFLLQADYQVKIGYNQDSLYLLLAFTSPVYYRPYLWVNQQKYYIFNTKQTNDLESIKTYAIHHVKQQKTISLLSAQLPQFPQITNKKNLKFQGKTIELSYDQSLCDFYSNYPSTEMAVYLMKPLSDIARKRFMNILAPQIINMTDQEKINFLLNFIQFSFPYKSDIEQFSQEKYMFAEETLAYPYTDCEDRVILLDKLVKEFTDLKTIVLLYPDHVVLGVQYQAMKQGAYIQYKGNNYYIADPTYLGAKFGMLMSEFVDKKAQILTY